MAPSGWDGAWYPPPSKPRPVEGGLRARSRRGQIGQTWWSRRFLDLLESLGMGGRLDRGRRYARQGQVVAMDVEAGAVTATVQGSRARPYRVKIAVTELSEAQWREIEAGLVERALFTARLLAGEMPDDIEEVFAARGLTLFPARLDEFDSRCSCPDSANPCKHLAAVYYLLGEAFDDDPFLMLAWRGRGRDQLLANLRALRGGAASHAVAGSPDDPQWDVLEALPPVELDRLDASFWDAGSAPTVRPQATPAAVADAVLREREPLDRTVDGRPLTAMLAPHYAPMVTVARSRLLADEDPPA